MYKKSKQNQLKQKPLFPKRKRAHERFKFDLLQTFRCRKCNSIFTTSVIEVGVPLQNLKIRLLKAHSSQQRWCNFKIRPTLQSSKFYQQQIFHLIFCYVKNVSLRNAGVFFVGKAGFLKMHDKNDTTKDKSINMLSLEQYF